MNENKRRVILENYSPIERIEMVILVLVLGFAVLIGVVDAVLENIDNLDGDNWATAIIIVLLTLLLVKIYTNLIFWSFENLIPDVGETLNGMQREFEERRYQINDPSLAFAAYLFDKKRD